MAGRSPLGVSHWPPLRPFALESQQSFFLFDWLLYLPTTLFLALTRCMSSHTLYIPLCYGYLAVRCGLSS